MKKTSRDCLIWNFVLEKHCQKLIKCGKLILAQILTIAKDTPPLNPKSLTQPGHLRQRGQNLEVELDSRVQAKTLDVVLKKLKEDSQLQLSDGRKLAIWQAASKVES